MATLPGEASNPVITPRVTYRPLVSYSAGAPQAAGVGAGEAVASLGRAMQALSDTLFGKFGGDGFTPPASNQAPLPGTPLWPGGPISAGQDYAASAMGPAEKKAMQRRGPVTAVLQDTSFGLGSGPVSDALREQAQRESELPSTEAQP